MFIFKQNTFIFREKKSYLQMVSSQWTAFPKTTQKQRHMKFSWFLLYDIVLTRWYHLYTNWPSTHHLPNTKNSFRYVAKGYHFWSHWSQLEMGRKPVNASQSPRSLENPFWIQCSHCTLSMFFLFNCFLFVLLIFGQSWCLCSPSTWPKSRSIKVLYSSLHYIGFRNF